MKNNFTLLVLLTMVCSYSFGQSKEDIKKIISNYDLDKLKEKELNYKRKSQDEKQKAIAVALQRNWPIRTENPDGSISELMRISPEGFPIYYSTDNVSAARATRVNHLNSSGSLGLNLNGQGMIARVWDGGNTRTTHNAFGGRVQVIDDPSGAATSQHATHVTGTIVASANPAAVRGMAYEASARTFNWTNDESEAVAEAMGGMLISNHSYGVPITNNGVTVPAWFIGGYSSDAAAWDDITYNAPFFLPVMSAGNDGQNNNNPEPLFFGYDKLTSNKTAKNSLIVANCQDVIVAANGTITGTILINSSSSQGPTDDFRIKPDITGNGTGLTSTSNASDASTASLTGTSMSSPNVAGSLLLLQQHYRNLTNSFMRAATLKGLACHTADDAGLIGPDPVFGWGLLNTKFAAETITNNGLASWVSEESLNSGQVFTMNVNSNGISPLMASISWTDLPGVPTNGNEGANSPTPVLVNDLDIRVTRNNTVFFPYKLTNDPSIPAVRTGDNIVDNIEQVKIDTPAAGLYTITVTTKRSLVNDNQKFSLVVTGLSSSFSINSNSSDLTVCSNQNAVYTFNYVQNGAGTTTFSAIDLPTGATASFSPATRSSNGLVTMTISNLLNVPASEYFVGIRGTSATENETRYKSLRVFNVNFQPVSLQTPLNGQSGLSTTSILRWASQSNALNYRLQVSTSPLFSSFITDILITTTQFTVTGLSQATRYYWRVIPQNNCATAVTSNATVNTFATGTLVCNNIFTATDFSTSTIATVPNSQASVPVLVTGGLTIGDLNVSMGITHSWIGDIRVSLEGPPSIGSPNIVLLDIPCGNFQNINCVMDDDGSSLACSGNPAISGTVTPVGSLTSLNALPADGVWTLRVFDFNNEDGGTINSFIISICNVQNALSTVTNPILKSTVYPNPTQGIVNVTIPSLSETATIKLFDIQGRQMYSTQTNQVDTSFDINNLQDGIYLVNIANDQGSITKKIVLKRN